MFLFFNLLYPFQAKQMCDHEAIKNIINIILKKKIKIDFLIKSVLHESDDRF